MVDKKQTMTVEEAGEVLGISAGLAYELVPRGDLPSLRRGRRIVVPVQALEELLAQTHPPGRRDEPDSTGSYSARVRRDPPGCRADRVVRGRGPRPASRSPTALSRSTRHSDACLRHRGSGPDTVAAAVGRLRDAGVPDVNQARDDDGRLRTGRWVLRALDLALLSGQPDPAQPDTGDQRRSILPAPDPLDAHHQALLSLRARTATTPSSPSSKSLP